MSLSKKKINLLRTYVGYVCEGCHRHEKIVGRLEPHRINQELGYSLRNIKMVCKYLGKIGGKYSCHQIFSSAQRIALGTQK